MQDDGLQVIGAGFGRTGTFSLKTALEQLGFDPCFHMVELLAKREHIEQWERAERGEEADWGAVFEGYKATVDFPSALYFEQLAELYPDAKVILTERDPDAWYESARQTILDIDGWPWHKFMILIRWPFSRRTRKLMRIALHNKRLIADPLGQGKDPDLAKRRLMEHSARVREVIPADRLLVFSVKQGWEPLCEFLGVDVPDTPFPRTNERAGFKAFVTPLFK